MNLYLKQLLVNWNVCRIVRMAGGLLILITGIRQADWPVILFGSAFLAAGLFSTQCCAGGACYTASGKQPVNDNKAVEFEEIK